ncbi:acidic endochitinase-like [Nymphaea colorata]|uniref:acidic endochitinase-like n=1 Tax=Nymphaea colorata TaxID=210225 RepID=UPI00129D6B60|nr:acidic endochitinase-like [Nymphaea colorata]
MASSSSPPTLPLLLVLCMATAFTIRARPDHMAIYWGWHINNLRGSALKATCETHHFSQVNIAFLSNFGNGRPPRPDFGTSCDAQTGGCKSLQDDIAACQRLGVKVLLSIGGFDVKNYTLASAEEAHQLASHIYDVYLSGYGIDGPLGKVKLDGVDFYVNDASTYDYWDVLAQDLKQLDSNMILTASQGCNHTTGKADMPLYHALKTGLFSKVWPRYYGHPCTYQPSDTAAFAASVNSWATEFSGMDFYLGLIANPLYFEEGWISPLELPGALTIARQHSNYDGVMLWNRHWDVKFFEEDGNSAPYSDLIYPIVKTSSNIRMPVSAF